jgi:hypothetical protein
LTSTAEAVPSAVVVTAIFVLVSIRMTQSLAREGSNMSPTTVTRGDPSINMPGAAVVFLAVSIVLSMVFGGDMHAIRTGVVMLALVAVVYFTGVVRM